MEPNLEALPVIEEPAPPPRRKSRPPLAVPVPGWIPPDCHPGKLFRKEVGGRRVNAVFFVLLSYVHESTKKVAVEHLTMLIGLVEEMTAKWERQLENFGEASFTDEILGREGTKCKQPEVTLSSRAGLVSGTPRLEPVSSLWLFARCILISNMMFTYVKSFLSCFGLLPVLETNSYSVGESTHLPPACIPPCEDPKSTLTTLQEHLFRQNFVCCVTWKLFVLLSCGRSSLPEFT